MTATVLRPSPLAKSSLSPLSRSEFTASAKDDVVHPTHAAVLWGNLLADHLAQQEVADAFQPPTLSAAAPAFVPKGRTTPKTSRAKSRGGAKQTASLNANAPAFAPGSSAIKKPKAWTPKAWTPKAPTKAATATAENGENDAARVPTANAATGVRLTGHLTGIKLVRSKSDRSRLLSLAQDIVGTGLPLQRSAASDLALSLDSLGFSA